MAEDITVIFQSKVLRAFCLAFGIDPTPDGLIRAAKGEPEQVAALVAMVTQRGPAMVEEAEAALKGTVARLDRMELEQLRQSQLLAKIALNAGIAPTSELIAIASGAQI